MISKKKNFCSTLETSVFEAFLLRQQSWLGIAVQLGRTPPGYNVIRGVARHVQKRNKNSDFLRSTLLCCLQQYCNDTVWPIVVSYLELGNGVESCLQSLGICRIVSSAVYLSSPDAENVCLFAQRSSQRSLCIILSCTILFLSIWLFTRIV
jgi:hypothetical protein